MLKLDNAEMPGPLEKMLRKPERSCVEERMFTFNSPTYSKIEWKLSECIVRHVPCLGCRQKPRNADLQSETHTLAW